MFDLRYLPIITGICGGLLLIINRWLTTEILPSQSRSDAVGIIACAVLILTSLIWQRVQPRSPEIVQLDGAQVLEFNPSLPDQLRDELAWASHIILTNTVTKSLVVWWGDRLILRRGILPEVQMSQPGAIVTKAIQTQQPAYLVKLALYPGKVEFDYLPANTQGVIVQPLGDRGVMILGANVPRSYTKQDENWFAAIAAKLAYSLEKLT
ncbi:MAG: cofactor assembly of complex C subunit B [Pseudanabaenaceae cyanobacterium bins.68]|nr:cofactor assembly of complex C subunit B [Pseudanabaenaceae cyanobacterium bins.68]